MVKTYKSSTRFNSENLNIVCLSQKEFTFVFLDSFLHFRELVTFGELMRSPPLLITCLFIRVRDNFPLEGSLTPAGSVARSHVVLVGWARQGSHLPNKPSALQPVFNMGKVVVLATSEISKRFNYCEINVLLACLVRAAVPRNVRVILFPFRRVAQRMYTRSPVRDY